MCLSPIRLTKNVSREVDVPCGKCPKCTARRASGWSFRLTQHFKTVQSAQFVTLTYDTQHVPLTPRGFMTLSKRDCQLFFKSLRKAHDKGTQIKYYIAGEYGGKTKRPHYHIILFNAKIELIQKAWDKGQVHYGEVNEASIGYTLKYISKPSRIPEHQNDDRLPEFALMSKGLAQTISPLKWSNGITQT